MIRTLFALAFGTAVGAGTTFLLMSDRGGSVPLVERWATDAAPVSSTNPRLTFVLCRSPTTNVPSSTRAPPKPVRLS